MDAMKVIACLLFLAGSVSGQEIEKSIKVKPCETTPLVIKNVHAKMTWSVVPTGGLEIWREYDPDPKVIKLRIEARKDAKPVYWLVLAAANGEVKQQICEIIVDSSPAPTPPAPPVPVPPVPVPPVPVPPVPIPPVPVPPLPSTLTYKLQAAYAMEFAHPTVKSGQKYALQGLYEAMADHAKDPSLTTAAELMNDLRKVAYGDKTKIPPVPGMIREDVLLELRKAIALEVAAALGVDTASRLDPDLRPRAVDVFTRIAKSLSEVK